MLIDLTERLTLRPHLESGQLCVLTWDTSSERINAGHDGRVIQRISPTGVETIVLPCLKASVDRLVTMNTRLPISDWRGPYRFEVRCMVPRSNSFTYHYNVIVIENDRIDVRGAQDFPIVSISLSTAVAFTTSSIPEAMGRSIWEHLKEKA